MEINDIVKSQLETEKSLWQSFNRAIRQMPPGSLRAKSHRSVSTQFYAKLASSPKLRYLGKNDGQLIEALKYKRFLEEGIRIFDNNIPLMEQFLSTYEPCSYNDIMARVPEAFGRKVFSPINDDNVMSHEYNGSPVFTSSENPFHPEHLIHHTTRGLLVRSKSEAFIADTLMDSGFTIYYEKGLELWDSSDWPQTVYPDFTIPLSHDRVIYWEHAGLMGDPGYVRRHNEKVQLYFRNNIYPPKNLIITFDGPNQEFDMRHIRRIVDNIKAM